MKKVILNIFILFAILSISHLFIGNAKAKKNSLDFINPCLGTIRPPEDSKLRSLFDQIINSVNPPLAEKDILLLKEWGESKKQCSQLLEDALENNHLKFPQIDVSDPDLPYFADYKSLAGLKLINVKTYMNTGRHAEAIKNILDVIRFGSMVRFAEKSTILNYMIGTAIEGNGIKWLQDTLLFKDYSTNSLENILIQIQDNQPSDNAFINSINSELNNFIIPSIKLTAKQINPILSQLHIDHESVYDVNDSIQLHSIQIQHISRNAMLPWPKRNQKLPSEIDSLSAYNTLELEETMYLVSGDMLNEFDINNIEHVKKWREVELAAKGKKNLLGRLYFSSSFPFDSYYQRSVELRTKSNMTKTLIALKIYYNAFGNYPERLSKLNEISNISKLPMDLFSNRPFNYSAAKLALWSVGSDEINNMGDQEKDIVLFLNNKMGRVKTTSQN
jgi:hypothetical protein